MPDPTPPPVDRSPALAEVTSAFDAAHGESLRLPEWVWERCEAVSTAFVKACQTAGIPARLVSGARFGETPEFPGVRLVLAGHFAALVADPTHPDGEVVYDWTARQFDPAAPVPRVVAWAAWRQEWEPLGPDGN